MSQRTLAALAAAAVLAVTAGCDPDDSASRTITAFSDKCSLDTIDGKPDPLVRVKAGVVEFAGWAVDSTTHTVPATLQVFLKDSGSFSYSLEAPHRIDRPDVAAAFKQDGFLKSGFLFQADLSSLKPGAYALSLKMPDDGRLVACPVKKNLVID